ncbi:MAG: transposase [Rickettsiales bacterium]|jgi:transposase-like protein|nr:transposase [Rickettsiales bacterium]
MGTKNNLSLTPARQAQLQDALQAAYDAGLPMSSIRGFRRNIVLYWNAQHFKIFPINPRNAYTTEQRVAILTEIAGGGTVAEVARKYGINNKLLVEWNNELHIYPKRPAVHTYTLGERIGLLEQVQHYNVYNNLCDGWEVVAAREKVSEKTLRNWNLKYKIVTVREIARQRILTDIDIQRIIGEYVKNNYNISKVVLSTGHSHETILKIIRENQQQIAAPVRQI